MRKRKNMPGDQEAPKSESGKEAAELAATMINLLAPKGATPVVIPDSQKSEHGKAVDDLTSTLLSLLQR